MFNQIGLCDIGLSEGQKEFFVSRKAEFILICRLWELPKVVILATKLNWF